MLPDITNLLPEDNIRRFRRVYFYRLVTFTVYVVALLTVIHATLLFPTHILLASQIVTREIEVEQLRVSIAHSNETALTTNLSEVLKRAARVMSLGKARSAGSVMHDILAVPHVGVSLSGLSYQAQEGTKGGTKVTLMGTASTRDDLRAYQIALQGLSIVLAAELPVSEYTKRIQIPFSIVITLRPQ